MSQSSCNVRVTQRRSNFVGTAAADRHVGVGRPMPTDPIPIKGGKMVAERSLPALTARGKPEKTSGSAEESSTEAS